MGQGVGPGGATIDFACFGVCMSYCLGLIGFDSWFGMIWGASWNAVEEGGIASLMLADMAGCTIFCCEACGVVSASDSSSCGAGNSTVGTTGDEGTSIADPGPCLSPAYDYPEDPGGDSGTVGDAPAGDTSGNSLAGNDEDNTSGDIGGSTDDEGDPEDADSYDED